MARAEIWKKIVELWQLPLGESDLEKFEEIKLIRQRSQPQSEKSSSGDERSLNSQDEPECKDLFENFTFDYDSSDNRKRFLRQYLDVYESSNNSENIVRSVDQTCIADNDDKNMMASHVFPLNDTREEKDWVLRKRRKLT